MDFIDLSDSITFIDFIDGLKNAQNDSRKNLSNMTESLDQRRDKSDGQIRYLFYLREIIAHSWFLVVNCRKKCHKKNWFVVTY